MIKTEAKRKELRPSLNLQPPKNVSKALRHYDSELNWYGMMKGNGKFID